jgi:hypothetical protein
MDSWKIYVKLLLVFSILVPPVILTIDGKLAGANSTTWEL